jgi:ribosome-associated protein
MKKFYEHGATEEEADEGPSKSLLKRQSHDLQALGEQLVELPQDELDALSLPEPLRDAVMLARRITAHGGLYRQKQFIGKLMRKIDSEPIRQALDARRERHSAAARRFHMIERWRARLIDEPSALDEFMQSFPAADRSLVTRLIAQARHERDRKKPPKTARELFGVVEKIVMGEG